MASSALVSDSPITIPYLTNRCRRPVNLCSSITWPGVCERVCWNEYVCRDKCACSLVFTTTSRLQRFWTRAQIDGAHAGANLSLRWCKHFNTQGLVPEGNKRIARVVAGGSWRGITRKPAHVTDCALKPQLFRFATADPLYCPTQCAYTKHECTFTGGQIRGARHPGRRSCLAHN